MGGVNERKRNEFTKTKMLEMLMAAAASIGFNKSFMSGYSTPAATGISKTL